MKYFDNADPNTVVTKRERRAAQPASFVEQATLDKLADLARPKATSYNIVNLILETPEVVRWLRDKMLSGPDRNENGGKSRAPFKMAFMHAADEEARALIYWAEVYNIRPTSSRGLYVRWGQGEGVYGDDLTELDRLAELLAQKLDADGTLATMVATDPIYGVWTIRNRHYGNWPDMAAHFMATEVATTVPELEGLF